jgi:hypothetical protein
MPACRVSLLCNDRCIWENALAVMLRQVFLGPPPPCAGRRKALSLPTPSPAAGSLSRCSLNRGGETVSIGTKATGHCWPPGGGAGGCVPLPWGQKALPSMRNIISHAKQSNNSFSRHLCDPITSLIRTEMTSLPATAPEGQLTLPRQLGSPWVGHIRACRRPYRPVTSANLEWLPRHSMCHRPRPLEMYD